MIAKRQELADRLLGFIQANYHGDSLETMREPLSLLLAVHDELTARQLRYDVAEDWRPTSESINRLPEPLRRYVHDLETRCDPAYELRELVRLRDECAMLSRVIARLYAQKHDREPLDDLSASPPERTSGADTPVS